MLQRRQFVVRRLHNLLDALLTAGVFGMIYLLRNNLAQIRWFEDLSRLLPFSRYAPLMIIAAIVWPLLLNYHGLYDPSRLRKAFVNVGIIFHTSMLGTFFLIGIIYLFQMEQVSRFFLVGFGAANALVLIAKDLTRRRRRLRRLLQGKDIWRCLIVGNRNTARQAIGKIHEESYLGLKPVGVILTAGEEGAKEINSVPVVGSLENFRQALHQQAAAYVLFTVYQEAMKDVETAIAVCQEEGVECWLYARALGWNLPQMEIDHFAAMPILVLRTAPVLSWAYVLKIFIDRSLALVFLLILSPLLLLLSLGIFVTSGRPVLYRQTRIGRFGQPFSLYKFRTLEEGKTPFPVGSFLRRMGLDEIPQLINILKGEMSFVGPRPHVPEEVERYSQPWQRRRFSMRPGLTCYRQVLRPGKVVFDEAIALDLKYIDRWSLWADFFLLYKTVILFFRRLFVGGKGAAF
ncbi:MAG: exopolysaccharide biosynthesis polyprenyl glycosylphosphotransferase [Deltaproteobacteria bacterium]|nr:exopolysaccharide biosynthesis polyprenyl glycosylphosphotransferase [Deltaproteobacteria bacterium]